MGRKKPTGRMKATGAAPPSPSPSPPSPSPSPPHSHPTPSSESSIKPLSSGPTKEKKEECEKTIDTAESKRKRHEHGPDSETDL